MYIFRKITKLLTIGLVFFSSTLIADEVTRILKLSDHPHFGVVTVGESTTQELTIYNIGNSDLNVTSIRFHENLNDVYSTSWSGIIEPESSHTITITFTPTEEREYNGRIYVESDRTNLDEDRSRTLFGTAMGSECSKILKLNPSPFIDFGNVIVGNSLTKDITLSNEGTCPLNIEEIRFHENLNGVFSGFEDGIIEPGESITTSITFTPIEAVSYNGLFYLETDRTNTHIDRSRLLTGNGVLSEDINDTNRTRVVIGSSEENITKTICSIIPEIDSEVFKKVDIMFLVDVSGSYGDDLATFRTQSVAILSSFAEAGVDVQIGVSSFSDYPISPYGGGSDYAFRLNQPLTSNYSLVTTAINNLALLWGSDQPESQLEALFQTGESTTGWREDALPIIFLATDANFHNSDDEVAYPGHGLNETVAKLIALGIKVFGLQSGGVIEDVIEIANLTDGSTFNLSGDSGEVVRAITDAITDVSTNFSVDLRPVADTAHIVQSITPQFEGAVAGDSFLNVNSGDEVCFDVVFGRGIYADDSSTQKLQFSLKVLAEDVALIKEIPLEVVLERDDSPLL